MLDKEEGLCQLALSWMFRNAGILRVESYSKKLSKIKIKLQSILIISQIKIKEIN